MSKRNNSETANFKQSLDEYLTVKKVLEKYDLKLRNIRKIRNGFKLETHKGNYHLKIARYSEKDVLFTYHATEYLYKKGFKNLTRFYHSQENSPYIWEDGKIYFITDWVNGRECNLDDVHIIERITKLMAYFHIFARGFYSSGQGSGVRQEWGNWKKRFADRLEQLRNFKNLLKDKRHKERFDRKFLKYADYFIEQGELAIKDLDCDYFYRLVEKSKKELHFCHRDFIPNNIIIGNENEIALIDFENCAAEIQLDDLGKFMRKIKNLDIDKAKFIIETYHKINPLCGDDIKLLAAYLRFPLEFWTVVRRHYENGRHSSKILGRLIDNADAWESFVDILEITDFSYLIHIKPEIDLALIIEEIENGYKISEYKTFSNELLKVKTNREKNSKHEEIYTWGEIEFSDNTKNSYFRTNETSDAQLEDDDRQSPLFMNSISQEDIFLISDMICDSENDYHRQETLLDIPNKTDYPDNEIARAPFNEQRALDYEYLTSTEAATTIQAEQTIGEEITRVSFINELEFDTEGEITFEPNNEIQFSMDDFRINYDDTPKQHTLETDSDEINTMVSPECDRQQTIENPKAYEPEEYVSLPEENFRTNNTNILQGGINLNSDALERENTEQTTDSTILDDSTRELEDTISSMDEIIDDTPNDDKRETEDDVKVFFIKGEKEHLEKTVEEIEKLFGEDRQKAIEAILEKNKLEVESCEDRIEPSQTVTYDENVIIPQIEKEERLPSFESPTLKIVESTETKEQAVQAQKITENNKRVADVIEQDTPKVTEHTNESPKTRDVISKGTIVWKNFPQPLGK